MTTMYVRSQELVARVRPLLAGQGPHVQGAVLADLVAIWLAGWRPSEREEQLGLLVETIMFGEGGHP